MTIEDTGHDTADQGGGKETGPQVVARYLKHLGTGAGVYRMLNAAGEVIYVGKARNLKSPRRRTIRASADIPTASPA